MAFHSTSVFNRKSDMVKQNIHTKICLGYTTGTFLKTIYLLWDPCFVGVHPYNIFHEICTWFYYALFCWGHVIVLEDIIMWFMHLYSLGLSLFTKRHCLTGIGIPIINLTRSDNRFRFIMGIPIAIRWWIDHPGLLHWYWGNHMIAPVPVK